MGFTANRDARWDLASVEWVLVWAAGAYPTVENSFSPHTDFPPGWESTATVAPEPARSFARFVMGASRYNDDFK